MEGQLAPDFITYLAGNQESAMTDLFTFAVDTLTFANKIHIYHWSCEAGFHHEHLQVVYETLRDFADTIVELALCDGKFKINSKNYLINDEVFNLDNAVRKLQFFLDELSKLSEQFKSKIAISNCIDDCIEKITKEVGLIKNFG